MKRHISTILIFAALLIGLSLLLYPTVSDYINSRHQTRLVSSYDKLATQMTEDEFASLFEAAEQYNAALARKVPNAFFHPEEVLGYEETLDITGTGIMGYITIERLNVTLPIFHSVDENVLQIAAGHLPGTSLPVGGEGTHCVLSGHRGLPNAVLFSNLDRMDIGDQFVITVLNRDFTYQVDQIKTVLPTETDDLQIKEGEDYCTLLTCTPYGVNSHRLLVRGTRVETVRSKPSIYIASEAYQINPIVVTPVVAAPMLLALAIALAVKSVRHSAGKKAHRKEIEEE